MTDRPQFDGTMPSGHWPTGPQLAVVWEITLETVWKAEWAPLRQEKFCAHIAENLAHVIEAEMGEGFAARVLVILNDDDRSLAILIRAGGFYRNGRQAVSSDVSAISALLGDAELSRGLIWEAINDTAYKGALD